jgi:hypothetical protein
MVDKPDTMAERKLDLDWLCCTQCGKELLQDGESFHCRGCDSVYSIDCGIPQFCSQSSQFVEDEREFWNHDFDSDEDGTFHVFHYRSPRIVNSYR